MTIIMKGFERERYFKLLNQQLTSLQGTITKERLIKIERGSFNEDILFSILSNLELPDILNCSHVSVFWNIVTQKFSLITQMNMSEFSWIVKFIKYTKGKTRISNLARQCK
jgi:hypothetical protein